MDQAGLRNLVCHLIGVHFLSPVKFKIEGFSPSVSCSFPRCSRLKITTYSLPFWSMPIGSPVRRIQTPLAMRTLLSVLKLRASRGSALPKTIPNFLTLRLSERVIQSIWVSLETSYDWLSTLSGVCRLAICHRRLHPVAQSHVWPYCCDTHRSIRFQQGQWPSYACSRSLRCDWMRCASCRL